MLLPTELLRVVDQEADKQSMNRSTYIRIAIMEKLKNQ
jgi:metal-responsive CopG/Arc/MetJ family transcriptional regulator